MCGNTMSVPLLTDAATVSGAERETAAVRELSCPWQTPGRLGDWLRGVGKMEVAVRRREQLGAWRQGVNNLFGCYLNLTPPTPKSLGLGEGWPEVGGQWGMIAR